MAKYVIYDKEDNYVYGGTVKELAKFLNVKETSLRSSISHIKNGRRKYIQRKYKVYTDND